mmetsp:Transcript_19730/g.56401  ORF Transcript_19730/g.56401 Transcript_19730/m.56401 type:complete len:360 (-) Transcript_19730:124-1203(-)
MVADCRPAARAHRKRNQDALQEHRPCQEARVAPCGGCALAQAPRRTRKQLGADCRIPSHTLQERCQDALQVPHGGQALRYQAGEEASANAGAGQEACKPHPDRLLQGEQGGHKLGGGPAAGATGCCRCSRRGRGYRNEQPTHGYDAHAPATTSAATYRWSTYCPWPRLPASRGWVSGSCPSASPVSAWPWLRAVLSSRTELGDSRGVLHVGFAALDQHELDAALHPQLEGLQSHALRNARRLGQHGRGGIRGGPGPKLASQWPAAVNSIRTFATAAAAAAAEPATNVPPQRPRSAARWRATSSCTAFGPGPAPPAKWCRNEPGRIRCEWLHRSACERPAHVHARRRRLLQRCASCGRVR